MASNKNSIYSNSLISFLLDTKPYSRKLTEINEIYRFNEDVNVTFSDELFTGVTIKSAWPYSFFSGGSSSVQPLKIQRISNYQDYGKYVNNQPALNKGAFKVGRDEDSSLQAISYSYNPKSLQGLGLKDCYVQKQGSPIDVEYLTEGVDAFISKGAYSFQIKQITNNNISGTFLKDYDDLDGPFPVEILIEFDYDELILIGPVEQLDATTLQVNGPGSVRVYGTLNGGSYKPQFKELRKEGLINAAQQAAASTAYDVDNPNSAINQVTAILNAIQAKLNVTPNATCQRELNSLFSIIAIPNLPYSYEDLIQSLIQAGISVIAGYATWNDVQVKLESLSPDILFNNFSDLTLRESGELYYRDIETDKISITNIVANSNRSNFEEYKLTALSNTQLLLNGTLSGNIGVAETGTRFESTDISFDVVAGTEPLMTGDVFVMTPAAKITIGQNAIQETWSIVKVNPIAYSRPIYISPSNTYAKIVSLDNKEGQITFLDADFPSGKIDIEVISSTQARLICEAEPDYSPIITFDNVFNDGRLGFIIINGSNAPLQVGDHIIMTVVNLPPQVDGLDLYYGYDTDAFDADNLVYNNVTNAVANYLTTLDFGYDSRFIGYDLTSFNLVVSGDATTNRSWRLRALADLSRPLLMPSRIVNLLGTDDPTNPSAVAKYDSDNDVTSEGIQSSTDPDTLDDLELWYSDRFALEYQDGESSAWQQVRNDIVVGQRYDISDYGIAFTVVPASKPFIASRSTSSRYTSTTGPFVTTVIEGGDTIQFKIVNPEPKLESPASILSNSPRLIMYGAHFYDSTPADWVITKVTNGFTLQGKNTTTNLNVYSTPLVLNTIDGLSYHIQEHNLHFTINEGRGMANGDYFTFTTFKEAALFLVHGSVSGQQDPAYLNKWYWNGKIGFKIEPSAVQLFIDGELQNGTSIWNTSFGTIELERLKEDLSDRTIIFTKVNDQVWVAFENGQVLASGENVISCEEFDIVLPTAPVDSTFTLLVKGISHEMDLGQDLIILNQLSERFPSNGDFVVIERIENDDIDLAIKPLNIDHNNLLNQLGSQTIDIRYAGNLDIPTSPELSILSNWIPLKKIFKGVSGNEVVFGNIATELSLESPFTLENIASIKSLSNSLNEDVYLTWDADFYDSYLPLNSESAVLAKTNAFNEKLSVKMRDNAFFLVSSAGLDESNVFGDNINVSIEDFAQINVSMNYGENFSIAIADGPFGGFMPGFDNLPYDFETLIGDLNGDGGGYYDAGQPLVSLFQRAKALSVEENITPQEQLELNNILGLIDAYLVEDIESTSIGDFISALNSDDNVNFVVSNQGFGYPSIGMAMSIKDNATSSASSNVEDAVTIISKAPGTLYDTFGYDIGKYDELSSSIALFTVNKNRLYDPLPIGQSFNEIETDLYAFRDIDSVNLTFTSAIKGYPDVYIWENNWSKPVLASYEKLSDKEILVSVPSADELKIATLASPAELFANGEQGAWYDPSDVSTLYQDAYGVNKVTAVEQSVGLMLDKRIEKFQYGPQLSSNHNYDTGLGETTSGNPALVYYDSVNNRAVMQRQTGNFAQLLIRNLTTTLISGKTYEIELDLTNISCNTGNIFILSNLRNPDGLSIVYGSSSILGRTIRPKILITPNSSYGNYWLYIQLKDVNVGGEIAVDNISVKEVLNPGNRAIQYVSANRPVLSARYNLLTKTEQFNDAVWINDGNTQGVSVTANATNSPNNTLTADLLRSTSGLSYHKLTTTTGISALNNFTFSIYAKPSTSSIIGLGGWAGAETYAIVYVDLITGENRQFTSSTATYPAHGNPVITNFTIEDANNGWKKLSLSVTNLFTSGYSICLSNVLPTGVDAAGWKFYNSAGAESVYIWGADFRFSNDGINLPSYQRVNTSTDYDVVGFPKYLRFDGTNDSLATNSINFTSTNKVTVFAGLRKLRDASFQCFAELSQNSTVNNGAFYLFAPLENSQYAFRSNGSILPNPTNSTAYPGLHSAVFTGQGDIANDQSSIRINGTQEAISNTNQGAGNYGNYPLYIGSRAGSSFFFNGRLYSLIIRGAQSSENEITAIESWVNQRTKALPSF